MKCINRHGDTVLNVLFVFFVLLMFCEVAEDSPHAEHWVLSIPRAGDPSVLPGQALRPFPKQVLAFRSGRCEMGAYWLESPFAKKDTFCFALPLPGLTFIEQKVSPHHEGKLRYWFQWMVTHLTELCARSHCAMTQGCFISAVEQGTERLLSTAAASPAASLKIQAMKFKCWIQLVWCAVMGVPKPWGWVCVQLWKGMWELHRYRSMDRWW